MNRDAMLVALGVGVGALISTEQGRHIIGSLSKTPVAQALGEGTMNLFRNMGNKDGQSAAPEDSKPRETPQQGLQTGDVSPETGEQGA